MIQLRFVSVDILSIPVLKLNLNVTKITVANVGRRLLQVAQSVERKFLDSFTPHHNISLYL